MEVSCLRLSGAHERACRPRARPLCLLPFVFVGALAACDTAEPNIPGPTGPSISPIVDGGSSAPPVLTDAGMSGPSLMDAAAGGGDASVPATMQLPCDVSAILSQRCGSCHGQTTDFGAPMSLVTWNDLRKPGPLHPDKLSYQLVLERVKNDASPMPPAPSPRLSADEIATLERWVTQGAPAATQACTPPVGGPDAGTDGGPSSEVPKPADCQQTYELRAHGGTGAEDQTPFQISSNPTLEGNQYHCFYFAPPYSPGSGMLWFESILDNTPKLHHWILYATDQAVQPHGTSAPCNANQPGAYFVVGWAPGATNTVVTNDVMLQMPSGPNAQLILEVHYYNNTGKSEPDRTGVRFCTGAPGTRPHTAAVHTLGSEGICIEPYKRGHEVVGTCQPNAGSDEIHITGVWPHMHKTARRMQVVVQRASGGSEVIHDAPFDFNAQIFHPKQNVIVRPGDVVETHCFYDNDSGEQIKYGERTQDEMCYAFVTAWPAGSLLSADSELTSALFGLPRFRCAEPLSIQGSCNGIADMPVTTDHPP